MAPAESDADLEEFLRIRNVGEQLPISRAAMAARETDDLGRLRLLARENERPIGAGAVSWSTMTIDASEAGFRIWVLPEARGRGAGSRMYDELVAFARAGGLTRGFCRIIAGDEASLEFARHRGFEVFGRNQIGRFSLDQVDVDEAIEVPSGISFASVSERPDLERAVYDLEAFTLTEVPSLAELPVPTFEMWRKHLEAPVHLGDLSLLALNGGDVVGSIEVDDDGDGTAFISMLSVAPALRRRGIARALKRELARRAAVAGWRTLETINDETNDNIRRLNEELGYRYLPEVLLLQASLGPG